MKLSNRIIESMPLESIWAENKEVQSHRIKYLTKIEIKELLRKSKVEFVIADVGLKLEWIDSSKSFDFWESEVNEHLVEDIEKIEMDTFKYDYAYVASQWESPNDISIILLEKFH